MKKERSLGASAPFFGGKWAIATCSNCSFSVRYKIQDTKIQDMKYPYGNSRSISCILYLCILYLFDKPKFETFYNRQSVGNERGHRRYGVPLVWPTRKDHEPRPRVARAGSTPKKMFLISCLVLPLRLSSSQAGQTKRLRRAEPFYLAYPKGFEPSTFRVGV